MNQRRSSGAVLGALMLLQVGCYTYQPIAEARPEVGQTVELDLTDAGRAALGNQLGPGVLTIEGTLQQVTNDQYVLGVSQVTTIRGGTAYWGGERVSIPVNDVATSRQRQFSRGKTALFAGVVIAGVTAFVLTRTLTGSATEQTSDTSRTPIGATSKVPW